MAWHEPTAARGGYLQEWAARGKPVTARHERPWSCKRQVSGSNPLTGSSSPPRASPLTCRFMQEEREPHGRFQAPRPKIPTKTHNCAVQAGPLRLRRRLGARRQAPQCGGRPRGKPRRGSCGGGGGGGYYGVPGAGGGDGGGPCGTRTGSAASARPCRRSPWPRGSRRSPSGWRRTRRT
jgi:hypothetical protein